ncbi:MAG TPA: phosphate-starvation-inducible PsiE family protein, partial [Acidimicrobiales bacterium]|nr:phosphate-starvation-inducible PsiE family protein [Acidimicrobiales bacterium]
GALPRVWPVADEESTPEPEEVARPADRALELAENVVYTAAGVGLVACAAIVLVATGYHLVTEFDRGAEKAVTEGLGGLLLVFVLLELLAGVRATMLEHKLVAEPFLVAGTIASIKEIIVVTLEASEKRGSDDRAFRHAMVEVGVLGGLVLALAAATWVVRRKGREPEER